MKKRKASITQQPGIAFEKAVASVQAQIDPTSVVSHNEVLKDRLGQNRQFDVVVRGTFAGQKMLGVIECKDLGRRIGTPEVDAFVTKAQDINANFKILMSRRGFSDPALTKCAHYGIQALSLLNHDPANKNFFVGTYWTADVTRWAQLRLTLHITPEPIAPLHFGVHDATIEGKRVIDWFTNHLLDQQHQVTELGWYGLQVSFETPQTVTVRENEEYLCAGISFGAEQVCSKYERLVGISGNGFFDWQASQATFPAGAEICSDAVPMDFSQWQIRGAQPRRSTGFIDIHLTARSIEFERVSDAIQLDQL